MSIGAIPVAEFLVRIGRASLCPHHLVLAVATASSSGYSPLFQYRKRELTQGMMRDDPRAIAEWNRKMSSGEKSSPEYEEMTERMERGEWPVNQIEEKRKELSGQGESKSEDD